MQIDLEAFEVEYERWVEESLADYQAGKMAEIVKKYPLIAPQDIPWTPRPEDSKSARMDGPDVFAGKKAKKLGLCQWVIPGRMMLSRSASTRSKGSPCSGGEWGNRERMSPGFTWESTG